MVHLAMLKQGAMLHKWVKRSSPKLTFLFLSEDASSLCWASDYGEKRKNKIKEVQLTDIMEVKTGATSDAFRSKSYKDEMVDLCFSIVASGSAELSTDWSAASSELAAVWVASIRT
eukprot:TRINITY_DN723_c0_g1_i1.p2 TRINITY_DN723_c0_g1~~TRINITY_DN723_c0_g1_i1.p2  ORF type:complete len:116 (+),score=26.25 TRINITY_DN723_c0_g1_i1:753-1100(+)